MIDGNNFDFSQGESCLRTNISWHVGLREHSVQLASVLDQLVASIKDESLLLAQVQTLTLLQNISNLEQASLMVGHRSTFDQRFDSAFVQILKQCIIDVLRERFHVLKYDFPLDYERAWNVFLSYIVEHLSKKISSIGETKRITVSPPTNIDQT